MKIENLLSIILPVAAFIFAIRGVIVVFKENEYDDKRDLGTMAIILAICFLAIIVFGILCYIL